MNQPVSSKHVKEFESLAFGLFLHWGLYSQIGEGEWIEHLKPINRQDYEQLTKTFTAEDFNPEAIAQMAKNAGMKYIYLTTRHHEGFSLYDNSGINTFDALHTPANRDLIGEFVQACRKYDLIPCLYHTTLDWHWHNKKTWDLNQEEFDEYLDYLYKSVEKIASNYGKIGAFWFDGNWSRPDLNWQLDRFYGMVRRLQPETIIVNNTGIFEPGKIEHPEIDCVTFENQSATPMKRDGMNKYIAGETSLTTNNHWGIGLDDLSGKSPAQLIEALCHARKCGTNYVLNIGPTAQGGIPDYERICVEQIGRWMRLFGEAIYNGYPCKVLATERDFVLQNGNYLYYFAHDLKITGHENVTIFGGSPGLRTVRNLPGKIVSASWLDNQLPLDYIQSDNGFAAVNFSGYDYGKQYVVRVAKIELELYDEKL